MRAYSSAVRITIGSLGHRHCALFAHVQTQVWVPRLQSSDYPIPSVSDSFCSRRPLASPQSCRNATTGSTRIARRAGNQQPSVAATHSTAQAVSYAMGSAGDTSTSSTCSTRVTMNDKPSPTNRPMPIGRSPCLNMSFRISCAVAPIAIRMPIS